MPSYCFNVIDGSSAPDATTATMPNDAEARIEAVRLAGEIMQSAPRLLAEGEDWRLDVTDDAGLILFSLTILTTIAPAVRCGR